ncbi:MAG: winged helix-turn-helix transcriptional regulator [Rhodospirillales bacterium]|nr:winged helix-turn-helix transcriptional regulator [Rhodospirillales bacterium]
MALNNLEVAGSLTETRNDAPDRVKPVHIALKELEHAGIVDIRPMAKGRGSEYHLTDAGKELYPVIEGMGAWAQRWVRDDLVVA